MTVLWTGAFSSTSLPAGQRITGWVEGTTGAGTLKNRYRDGDPAAAALWFEMYGNSNYQYAQSARTLWVDQFTPKAAGSVDPAKEYETADWTEMGAIYAVTPPLILLPNVRRGDVSPPRLRCRVSARRAAGAADVKVRLYAAPTLAEGVDAWEAFSTAAPTASRVEWSIESNTYPADPGWNQTNPGTDATTEQTITAPGYSWASYAFPAAAGVRDIMVMETVLILAGYGDGAGNGPLIRAIQVREEAPGA